MCKKLLRLGIMLALCLALMATAGLGEAADVVAAPVDVPAQGALDFEPVPEAVPLEAIPAANAPEAAPATDSAPASDPSEAAPGEAALPSPAAESTGEAPAQPADPTQPETGTSAEETPAQPDTGTPAQPETGTPSEETPAQPADDGTRAFGETAVIETDVWQDVNCVRAGGFSGPLALVNGQLTLVNVLLDGVPARDADLSAYFSLGSTGSVAIRDGGALSLNVSAFSLNRGSRATLSLTENGAPVPGKKAKWSSSDKGVAKVSKGNVSAKKAGTAVIAAEYNGATARCLVTVTDFKPVKSVKLNKSKLTLALFGSVQLAAAISPVDAHDPALTWASSDPQIVSVDQNGWIAGLSGGKATVTATASNGKKGSCKVTVKETKPKRVAFDEPYLTLNLGEQYAVQPQFTPALVSNPAVSYGSDDPAVATVSADGVINAVGVGSANIGMVCAADPSVTAACRVTVKDPDAQPAAPSGPFEITFMNIGRNDGILIHSGDEWAFIDSGGNGQGVKAVAYMRQRGVTALRYYIATHAHEDHVGGAPVILAAIPAQEVIIPHDGVAKSIRKYAETSEEKVAANAASYRVVTFGETFDLGGAEFLVLGPVEVHHVSDSSTKENDNSLILRVTYGANTFLLTGDATKKEFIATETARPGCLRAQVYKNPHHYARIEYAFRHCMPQIVVFSTDDAHQPAAKYLTVIQNAGSQVYITSNNRNGHVTIVSDGANLSVSTQY